MYIRKVGCTYFKLIKRILLINGWLYAEKHESQYWAQINLIQLAMNLLAVYSFTSSPFKHQELFIVHVILVHSSM